MQSIKFLSSIRKKLSRPNVKVSIGDFDAQKH